MLAGLTSDRAAGRSMSMAGILVAEYMLMFMGLALYYDGNAVENLPHLWQDVLWQVGFIVGGMILALSAAMIFWGGDILHHLEHSSRQLQPWTARWLFAHIVFLTVFASILFIVLGNPLLGEKGGYGLFAFWLITGVASLSALGQAALGPAIPGLIRQIGGILLGACVFGAFAAYSVTLVFPYWGMMTAPTLHLSAWILTQCCGQVYVNSDAALLSFKDFAVIVNASCSGIEGIILVGVFLAGYLYRFRSEHRFPQALLILPIGIILSYFANSLRIALLVLIGANVNPELATGAFHSRAGWIFFCLLTMGLVFASRRVAWFHRRKPLLLTSNDNVKVENPVAVYLLPFLIWLGFGMMTGALSIGFDTLYPLRVFLVGAMLFAFRQAYFRYRLIGFERKQYSLRQRAAPWGIGFAVFIMWLVFHPAPLEDTTNTDTEGVPWSTAFIYFWIAARLVGTSIIVPIIEELAFRGFLQRRLLSADFTAVSQRHWTWISVLLSAVMFGLLHQNWIAGTLAGIAFSYAAWLRGRLSDAMIAHGLTNFLLSVWVLAFGRWDLW